MIRRTWLRARDYLRARGVGRLRAAGQLAASSLVGDSASRLAAITARLVSDRRGETGTRAGVSPAPPPRPLDAAIRLAAAHWKEIGEAETAPALHRSVVLKPYVSPRERGVLLVSFEPQLQRLACAPAFPEIEDAYQVLFLPTWQPFYSVPLFVLAARARRPYGLMPSSSQDLPLCRHLGSLCEALPFQASSWVSADGYVPPDRKDVDLLMILGGSYKRHWKLFEALAEMPAGVKAVLAGNTRWTKRREAILSEAAAFGVSDRVTFVENPSTEALAGLLARARLFLGLSHREGSYIAVAEALMADTAVGLFRNATIGSKEYVNPQTGLLFDPERRLAPQIVEALERSSSFRPRAWAVEHISARRNHARLDALLACRSRERGEDWTVGIEPFHCVFFDFVYDGGADVERRFAPAHAWIERRLGMPFVRPSLAPAAHPERSASRT